MRIAASQLGFQPKESDWEWLVQPIDLTLEPGTITLLIGRTGSGKSTLLHMLAGVKPPAPSGQVFYGESPLWRKDIPNKELLKRIGFVYQYPEHQFFLPTVREELVYSLKPYRLDAELRSKRVEAAAEACGLQEELLARSPFFLSGGEKRKAALASVLAADPDWLLLDEPSSGLDSTMSAWLSEQLTAMKEERKERGGLVIATHDLDLFLPIADRIVVMCEGRAVRVMQSAELIEEPELLESVGIGVPDCLKLAAMRRTRGALWGAVELAAVWADELKRGVEPLTLSVKSSVAKRLDAATAEDRNELVAEAPNLLVKNHENPFRSLDPRSKWLVYILFSLGILSKPGWQVAAAGMIVAGLCARIAGMPANKWLKALLPMILFLLLSYGIAGVELSLSLSPFSLSDTSFNRDSAFRTFESLVPLVPVMFGGLVFANSTSPMSMKKGLEIPLRAIPGIRRWAEPLSLATSVLFRFLRWIPAEMERFSLLASVRGKKGGKPGQIRVAQLPAFFTPLLLSLMQQAEELSVALEARGYGRANVERTNTAPLRFKRKDGTACWAGVIIGMALAGFGWLFG